MITGVHALIFSSEAERARAFIRDVLGFGFVDAHDGWLIFGLPPAELAVHPATEGGRHQLFFMCDDIETTMKELEAKGVEVKRPISEESFGRMTSIKIPGGGQIGLYEPTHLTALHLGPGQSQEPADRRPS